MLLEQSSEYLKPADCASCDQQFCKICLDNYQGTNASLHKAHNICQKIIIRNKKLKLKDCKKRKGKIRKEQIKIKVKIVKKLMIC